MPSGMERWPGSAAQTQCVLCGHQKMPTLAMCFDCFQRHHVGNGHYSTEAVKRMNRAENNLADEDPWDAVFDDFEQVLGFKW